ncbi:MAG: NTP transferase domain-containing protein [Armatimonadota bacterium]
MLGAVLMVQAAGATDPARIQAATAALESVCGRVILFGGGETSEDATVPLPADTSDLAAVTAALRAAGEGHVAVLAADLVHPSAELLRYMNQVRGNFEAVVPEWRDGSLQPLLAIYHTSVLRRAQGLIAAGDRELSKLLELATTRRITVDEVAKFGEPERLLERAGPTPL